MLSDPFLTCKSDRFIKTCYLTLATSALVFLGGCSQPSNNNKVVADEAVVSAALPTKIVDSTVSVSKTGSKQNALALHPAGDILFAPVTTDSRGLKWRGGAPAMNKQASKINTYYHIRTLENESHLQLSLRFEGATYDDARVSFQLIDGAKFDVPNQQTQWRLKPNEVSEITFSLIVPSEQSYITLTTFQNDLGASRAFLLETRNASK
jgi:hypothetical protein